MLGRMLGCLAVQLAADGLTDGAARCGRTWARLAADGLADAGPNAGPGWGRSSPLTAWPMRVLFTVD